ncbi:hypothetical protein NW762_003821 [Fusarium torreyae]|uniref:Uncharacterized protein n=1 Tax=Fusarium torreyae TaxID=1237075 RepID=A0A9W8SBP3_9HYPO|nr:hypothetical protein NW762_003821 [Fusarium torreyae]
MRVSKHQDWTPEEDKTIKSYFKSEKTQQQIAVELNQGSSTSQVKVDQIRERTEELRLVEKAAPYTEAEQTMIVSGAQLWEISQGDCSRKKTSDGVLFRVWAPGMESFGAQSLPDYCEFGEHITTAVKSWVEQTGSKRTTDAVVARLNLTAAETAVLWTDEEDAALMTEALKSATETTRTDKDIIQRIEYLGLNLGPGPNPGCKNHSSLSLQGSHLDL